ncbi:hypothetical protein QA596_09715 [Balneolales bacterium ANBcel1]|nr:hypothetical protein [Balneolales bacterium ANBcel1]
MKRIIIDIEIKNVIEIVKKRKGRMAAFLAKYFVREEAIHDEVEARVVGEIQKTLEKNIGIRLHEEGIKARVTIRKENP